MCVPLQLCALDCRYPALPEALTSCLNPPVPKDGTHFTLDEWAQAHFTKKRMYFDRWTHIEYGYYRALDRSLHGEWQLHYTAAPFDELSHLLVIKLQHIPMIGRKGTLDEWLEEIHVLLKPHASLILSEDRVIDPNWLESANAPNA